MNRILFWILLIGLVGFAIRAKLKALKQQPKQPPKRPPPAAEIESMTQCAHCGLHFPSSEAVHADGKDYCSPGHVRLPPR
jgi:uncharacterized protein